MFLFRNFLSPIAALLVLLLLAGTVIVVRNSPFSHSNSMALASPPPVIQPLPHRTQLYSSDYVYLTDQEISCFDEYVWFFGGDSVYGPLRSNSSLGVHPGSYFGSRVVVGGHVYSPQGSTFVGPIIELAHQTPFQNQAQATKLRNGAASSGVWLNSENHEFTYGLWFYGPVASLWQWQTGTPSPYGDDSQVVQTLSWNPSALYTIFCDGELWISGAVHGIVAVGSAGNMRLMDNITYLEHNASFFPYNVDTTMHDMVTLLSEAPLSDSASHHWSGILIADTWANGREAGALRYPPGIVRQDFRDIAIHGHLIALNASFTFENQNDIWDSYQAPPQTMNDERGYVLLTGSVTQKQRGYVHRSNHGGTGYYKRYRQDPRFDPQVVAQPAVAPYAIPVLPETYSLPGRP